MPFFRIVNPHKVPSTLALLIRTVQCDFQHPLKFYVKKHKTKFICFSEVMFIHKCNFIFLHDLSVLSFCFHSISSASSSLRQWDKKVIPNAFIFHAEQTNYNFEKLTAFLMMHKQSFSFLFHILQSRSNEGRQNLYPSRKTFALLNQLKRWILEKFAE